MEMTNVYVEYLEKLYTENIGKKYEGNVKILKLGTNTVSRSLTLTFTVPMGNRRKLHQRVIIGDIRGTVVHGALQSFKGAPLEIIHSGDMKSLNGPQSALIVFSGTL